MRRKLIVLAWVSIFLFPVGSRIVRAQGPASYVLGLGVKLGSPCAISLKYMIDNRNALELLASGSEEFLQSILRCGFGTWCLQRG